jgi:hypothetical protein
MKNKNSDLETDNSVHREHGEVEWDSSIGRRLKEIEPYWEENWSEGEWIKNMGKRRRPTLEEYDRWG